MKPPLVYGLYLALAQLLLNVVLYLTGVHESAEGMQAAQVPITFVGIALYSAAVVLAIREKRATAPADRPWGYGSALGTGVLTILFGTVFGIVSSYIYYAFVNPGMADVLYQMQVAQMEANGMSPTQIAQGEETMRRFMTPLPMAVFTAFFGLFMGTLVALVAAIFFRTRPAIVAESTVPRAVA